LILNHNKVRGFFFSRSLLVLLSGLLLAACTGLDDEPLPKDTDDKIYFQEFELNAELNYVLTKLINESSYTLTSCRFRVNIYPSSSTTDTPLQLTEVKLGDNILQGILPALSESFFIRETLEPGYSTEVYFELALDRLYGPAVFTKEIVELKGR